MNMKNNYTCIYKGQLYRSDDGKITSLMYDYSSDLNNLIVVNDTDIEIERTIEFIPDVEAGKVSLKKYVGFFTKDLKIIEKEEDIITINLKGKVEPDKLEVLRSFINNKEFENIQEGLGHQYSYEVLKDIKFKNYKNTSSLINFLMFYMKHNNPYLYDVMNKDLVLGINISYKKQGADFIKNILINLFNATFISPNGFEKILKANPSIIYNSIGTNELSINDEGKMNKVIQLPKYVIEFTKKHNYQNLVPYLQRLNIDGNSYRILIDFLLNSNGLIKSNYRAEIFEEFLDKLVSVLDKVDYNITNLLNFLIKESYYRPCNIDERSYRVAHKYGYFDFPLEEIKLLDDYINMAKMNNLEAKKYPQILLDHNIIMKNLDSLNSIDPDRFEKAVDEYRSMVDNYSSHKYTIKAPDSVKELVEEGNALNHCVASYSHAVLKGQSKIFFLRELENPDKPYVTVEVTSDNMLRHIKGAYNIDPDIGVINAVNNWLSKNR